MIHEEKTTKDASQTWMVALTHSAPWRTKPDALVHAGAKN